MATAAARRYARAVFELAQEQERIDRWAERLAEIRELFSDPELAANLSNPTVAIEQREQLIAAVPHLFDEEAANLARLLVESGRIGQASSIEQEFQALADEAAGRVRATATTAVELNTVDRERLAKELSRRVGKEVRLSVAVDPRIVGGLKVQLGDRIIDATVASRLQQLRRRLAAI